MLGRRFLLHLLAIAGLAAGSVRAEPPRLEYVLPSSTILDRFRASEVGIEAVSAGGTQPIPLEGAWALRGSVFDFAGVAWLPAFALRPTPRLHARPPRMADALVSLTGGAPDFWRVAELRGAIAVFVWIVQGQVTQVNPVPVRPVHLRNGEIAASARFQLSAKESRGLPAVLLLRENQWIPPQAPLVSSELLRTIVRQADDAAQNAAPVSLDPLDVRQRAAVLPALIVAHLDAAVGSLLREIRGSITAADWTRWRETAVRSGAAESLRLLLAAGGSIPADTLATLLEEAVSNRQEACALALLDHARRAHLRLRGQDTLTLLALEEGLVGSSRVDLQACKLEYSIVSPK